MILVLSIKPSLGNTNEPLSDELNFRKPQVIEEISTDDLLYEIESQYDYEIEYEDAGLNTRDLEIKIESIKENRPLQLKRTKIA